MTLNSRRLLKLALTLAAFAAHGCSASQKPEPDSPDEQQTYTAQRVEKQQSATDRPESAYAYEFEDDSSGAMSDSELGYRSAPTPQAAPPAAMPSPAGRARGTVRPKKAMRRSKAGASRSRHKPGHPNLGQPLVMAESPPKATEAGFKSTKTHPLSTFSVDVDTASYSNVRRMLRERRAIPASAVRIEEMINYFSYDYPEPTGKTPFSVTTEVASAPWAPERNLVLIGLQGKHVHHRAMPPRNLVFLLDVSGSMGTSDKLPLLKRSFATLLDTLNKRDRVAIVVYAGASGLVLPPTPANQKERILDALNRLDAGGSTNGGAGIELAYQLAENLARKGSINRVILATDGDFNVGPTSQGALTQLIEKKRESGVFLTVLGFGTGYNDHTLEMLADKGNGNYAYIDSFDEAKKVLVKEAGATLLTIAKDVKLQVEFNPAVVGAYRLIGYNNRRLANRDFNDDKKDAGDIGAGHSVTALYEVLTPKQSAALSGVDALKYQRPSATMPSSGEMMTVKLRYKQPDSTTSRLLNVPVANITRKYHTASDNFRFASAVACFGMLLRNSQHRGATTAGLVKELAAGALGSDPNGYRKEFLSLVPLRLGSQRLTQAR